jgi:tRNA (cytidine/uridine-2'-O-)-methyltransferase
MPLLHIVLVEPEIPPNTGNIARLCAVTGFHLHLIEPLGFQLNDSTLRRAGMDYWSKVEWTRWPHWSDFLQSRPDPARLWFIEEGGPTRYDQAHFNPGDALVFGRETAGLPRALLDAHARQWLHIPMHHPEARSLNLSNCVALVAYEAWRQCGFSLAAPPRPA